MKINKVAAACVAVASMVFVSTFANAENDNPSTTVSPTNGKIEFKGSLVNSACGLTPESSPVKVNFGEIPTSQLKDNQRAGSQHAKIMLQGCDTTVATTATVTYTPATQDTDRLASIVSDTAKGAGIGLVDSGDRDVTWGQATSPVTITNGNTDIDFVAYLQADNKEAVTPGAFQSTINFQIDYQ